MGEERLPARIAGKPTWLISEVSRLSHQLLTGKLATAGSRGYHARLLAALDEFGPLSQASLGRHTGLDPSDVVAALNELTARGFVSRLRDPADARRNIVTLTAAGAEHLHVLDRLLGEVQEELLAPLSAPERAELVRLLERLLDRGSLASSDEAAVRRPAPPGSADQGG